MNTLIILFALLFSSSPLKQEHTDQASLKIDVSKYDKINIYNTGGAINVKSTTSQNATFNSTRKIKATTGKKLQRAIAEIYVDTISMDDELFVYIANPEKVLRNQGGDYLHYQHKDQQGNIFGNIKSSGIDFEFDFEITLPADAEGVISTHKGDIEVNGVKGELAVLNHFGDIRLSEVHKVETVRSHHGELKVLFDKQPEHDISLNTHHGNITISFKDTPSAMLDLYSYHGSFFTDFDWKPSATKVVQNLKNGKTKYKIGKNTNVRIGGGEHKIKFKSHHGNMYILKH